jgi:chlorophyll synthase
MTRSALTVGVEARPALSAVVELVKPITWFPPMWAFGCGVVSSGVSVDGKWPVIIAGVALAGPLVCATCQAVNDWFDRVVDAINEPGRPIPSGRIPGRWGLHIAVTWSLLSLIVAAALGPWVFWAAMGGLVLAWAYSAPPIRLKQNGWWGNLACGVCYEGLAWVTGAAVMLAGALPDGRILLLAALYSAGAHGIMTLNDFKSVAGDRQMEIRSLPVRLGVENAGRVACLAMAVPQAIVVALLFSWDRPWHAAGVGVLLAIQLIMMSRFLEKPSDRALWFSALGVNFFVLGMLVAAFAVRSLPASS